MFVSFCVYLYLYLSSIVPQRKDKILTINLQDKLTSLQLSQNLLKQIIRKYDNNNDSIYVRGATTKSCEI